MLDVHRLGGLLPAGALSFRDENEPVLRLLSVQVK
jgi:hypothetical protein